MQNAIQVIDPERHSRMIEDLDNICHMANIPKHMIYESAVDSCSLRELDWIRNFRTYQVSNKGLLVVGSQEVPVDKKFMAIAAALVRNFIDARVVTLNGVLGDNAPNPTVLLVPNLFVEATGKGLPAWKIQQLYDYLIGRCVEGRVSVLYVEDLDSLQHYYGQIFRQHLSENYILVKGE